MLSRPSKCPIKIESGRWLPPLWSLAHLGASIILISNIYYILLNKNHISIPQKFLFWARCITIKLFFPFIFTCHLFKINFYFYLSLLTYQEKINIICFPCYILIIKILILQINFKIKYSLRPTLCDVFWFDTRFKKERKSFKTCVCMIDCKSFH